jgi:hypothetical protein
VARSRRVIVALPELVINSPFHKQHPDSPFIFIIGSIFYDTLSRNRKKRHFPVSLMEQEFMPTLRGGLLFPLDALFF